MGNFNRLPTEIVLDILTRLPTESVLVCKSVCKPWKNLVSNHQSFYQLHLARLNQSFCQLHLARLNQSTESDKLTFLTETEDQLHYFEFDENNAEAPIDCIRRINVNPPFPDYHYLIRGSINGLVYLENFRDHIACICNPVTREYVILPNAMYCNNLCGIDKYIHFGRGFGYDSVSNEYKVVELYKLRRDTFIKVAVYTLGSCKGWRVVGRLDYKICRYYERAGMFANGALHWVDKEGGRVLAFDLTEEKFREPISPPPSPLRGAMPFRTIGELGGVLYYVTRHGDEVTSDDDEITKDRCLDIWLHKKKNDIGDMKGQVEDEPLGWSKEFSLLEVEPLAFTKSGSVLCFNYHSLGIYDPIVKTSKQLLICKRLGKVFPHKNTLLSLIELGEDNVKKLEPAKIGKIDFRDLPTIQLVSEIHGYAY